MRWLVVVLVLFQFSAFAEVDSLTINDKTVLEIVNGKEIFQSEPDFWDKYSSGLIALGTVILSLWISFYQAKKSIKATRANSISEARIEWIQNLRPLLSDLIANITLLKFQVRVLKQIDNPSRLPNEIHANIQEIDKIYSRIKLYLNKSEPEHQELLKLTEHFLPLQNKSNGLGLVVEEFDVDDYTQVAQIVLKNAWEQAKSEG